MKQLKNCPFCNCQPQHQIKIFDPSYQKVIVVIKCANCEIELKTKEFYSGTPFIEVERACAELIEKWNIRECKD